MNRRCFFRLGLRVDRWWRRYQLDGRCCAFLFLQRAAGRAIAKHHLRLIILTRLARPAHELASTGQPDRVTALGQRDITLIFEDHSSLELKRCAWTREKRLTTKYMSSELYRHLVRFRSPVAVELPHVPHFTNLVEIQLRGDQLILVA